MAVAWVTEITRLISTTFISKAKVHGYRQQDAGPHIVRMPATQVRDSLQANVGGGGWCVRPAREGGENKQL